MGKAEEPEGVGGHQLAVVAYRSCWLYWSPIGWSARAKRRRRREEEGEESEENLTTSTLTVGKNM